MVNTTIVTGTNIIDRHRKLVPSIGTLPQEDDSYFLVTRLMIGLPIAVTLTSLLDWGLVYLYQKKFHPWVGIIEEDEEIPDVVERKVLDESESEDEDEVVTEKD